MHHVLHVNWVVVEYREIRRTVGTDSGLLMRGVETLCLAHAVAQHCGGPVMHERRYGAYRHVLDAEI